MAETSVTPRSGAVLTNKGKYALKALVHLAGYPPDQHIHVIEIATSQHISKKFLDTILGELRNAGFVTSRMGKGGGYALARSPDEIIVGDVIRAIEGRLASIPCASKTHYRPCLDCPDESSCSVRLVMIAAQRAIADVLDRRTLADMRQLADLERLSVLS